MIVISQRLVLFTELFLMRKGIIGVRCDLSVPSHQRRHRRFRCAEEAAKVILFVSLCIFE